MRKNKLKEVYKFNIVRKGYDKVEVEKFIEKEKNEAENIQMQQIKRIEELKHQCSELSQSILDYKNREEQISQALMQATEKAKNLESDVKIRYKTELDRLRLFREKWTNCYEKLCDKYKFNSDALNMESVCINTEIEIQKVLNNDFSLLKGDSPSIMETEFKNNAKRLTENQSNFNNMQNGVDELLNKINDASKQKTLKKASSDMDITSSTTAVYSLDFKNSNIWN